LNKKKGSTEDEFSNGVVQLTKLRPMQGEVYEEVNRKRIAYG